MDWKTILTSSVIAAVISGIFAIIQQKNSTTARYVIEQREEWREKIRGIADEIYSSDEKTIKKFLVKLKTRINPYGKFCEFVRINTHDIKEIKRKNKKQFISKETQQEEYYLKDGHIWHVIKKLENGIDFDQNKDILIDYLTYLVKFDWERAKIESIINKKMLFSLFIEAFSFVLLLFNLSCLNLDNKNDTIISVVAFLVVYALPVLSIVLINSQSVLIKKSFLYSSRFAFLGSILILILIIILSFIFSNNIMGWASILSLVSIVLLIASLEDRSKIIREYINDLTKIDDALIKKSETNKAVFNLDSSKYSIK